MIATPHETPQARTGAHLFRHLRPDLVLDIGANVGESMRWFREIWPKTPVWSFEPRENPYRELAKAVEGTNCEAFWFAITDDFKHCTRMMNVFPGSDGAGGSSSLLQPTDLLIETRPWAKSCTGESVACITLDRMGELFSELDHSDFKKIFVKIDVQGYEDRVVKGGIEIFSEKVVGALVEIEHEPLYQEAATFEEIDDLLRGCGLHCAGAVHKAHRGARLSWADWLWLK